MPPPTPTSTSPARMAWSRITVARTPEAHTLLTVSLETSFGMPALICAWREGICPWPACRTWPITTCSTCSGSTFARSSAHLMAVPPSSVASSEASPPPILPIGVRAVPRITVLGMALQDIALMRISAVADAPAATAADTIVIGLFEGEDVARDVPDGALQRLVDSGEAKRRFKALAVTHAGGKRWLVAGLGARDAFDAERARVAAA